ncbi:DUF4011 domain-containing protein [Pseudomonas sp. NA-150]|uniref:DUF4011 domain-containing protein n=1 Tax=Pseudomonas sp. NA-150 TaxID=3367525 RepID=UPI0037CB523C
MIHILFSRSRSSVMGPSPLILLPVKLERKSALSGVTLSMLDEEPRFNLTLLDL